MVLRCSKAYDLGKGRLSSLLWARDAKALASVKHLVLTGFMGHTASMYVQIPGALVAFPRLKTCTLITRWYSETMNKGLQSIDFPAKLKHLLVRMGVPEELELCMQCYDRKMWEENGVEHPDSRSRLQLVQTKV